MSELAISDDGIRVDSGQPAIPDVVQEAQDRAKICIEWYSTAHERMIEDLKFAEGDSDNGYQWPQAIRRNRDVDKRPCLTMNITRQHNLQIINANLQNKSAIKIRATGGKATRGSANLLAALIRQIEYRSGAHHGAYKIGSRYQVRMGLGWWRLRTDYVNDDSFDQEIIIDPVLDPIGVMVDPNCKQPDKSDARYGFVFDNVPRHLFDEAYPKLKGRLQGNTPLGLFAGQDEILTKRDMVRVAEYFRKVEEADKLASFIDPRDGIRKTLRKSKMPQEVWDYIHDHSLTKLRDTKSTKVEWYLLVGQQIADSTEWPGKYIPLIPVIGEEQVIEGICDIKGHTRNMKDAQRMYNYNCPLALGTPLPTPYGWTTMGAVERGDELLNEHGEPVKVLGTSPVFTNRKCFEIIFDNNSKIIADEGHLWRVEQRGKRKASGWTWTDVDISTAELVPGKHFVCSPASLQLPTDDTLPIAPYVLGVWLGDGHAGCARISCHLNDADEMRANIAEFGYSVGETRPDQNSNGGVFNINGIRSILTKENLTEDKHIPAQYLRASEEQRWELLQGLMDTDGHVTPAHQCVFVNTNEELVTGVIELLNSFGIKSSVQRVIGKRRTFPGGRTYDCKDQIRVSFTAHWTDQVFRLSRKKIIQQEKRPTHWRRTARIGIISVTEVPSVPVKCVGVDSETHLFLAGWGMVPTHNSAQVEHVALQSKTPYIAAAKAIEEYEVMWNTANVVNHSVLIYNSVDPDYPDKPLPPPQRQQAPTSSPGFQEGMETAFNQMMMTSGQWQNQMGMMGNERTGAALRERKMQGDTSTYHFQDNYEAALVLTGRQILDLVPRVYDTKRLMKLQTEDGDDMDVSFDPSQPYVLQEEANENGEIVGRILNPTIGEYDVIADVGAAYGTRRQETVEAMTLILTQAPGLTGIIGDLLLRAMDFKEAEEAAERLRRMIPQQALGKGPSPIEQQLQQRLAASQAALSQAMEKYAQARTKLVGKAEMRDIDVYKAQTERIAALAKLLPDDPGVMAEIMTTLSDEGTDRALKDILAANKTLVEASEEGDVAGSEGGDADGGAASSAGWDVQDPTKKQRYMRIGSLIKPAKE